MVVSSPWPVCTTVPAGSVSSFSRMESRIVGKSLKDRPVAPGPPWNSVSPENTTPSPTRQTPPGECPGVWTTVRTEPATGICCPSVSSPDGGESCLASQSIRSSGWIQTGASSSLARSSAASMWSSWPCVHTMARTGRPPTAAAIAWASWAASMTTTSSSSP